MVERLNRYLARAGVASRRTCDELIFAGRVRVNGEMVRIPGHRVDPDLDRVEVDSKAIEPLRNHTYLLLHKPPHVITTLKDPQGRPTVMSVVGHAHPGRRLYPVGRLDGDTTGALLLTDDGELAHRLAHPRYRTQKEYQVRLTAPIDDARLQRLRRGVDLEDGPARCDRLDREGPDRVVVVIHQGRKHIVKRMFEAVGAQVEQLHRRHFAGLSADELVPGQWRELTDEEVARLRREAGLPPNSGKDS